MKYKIVEALDSNLFENKINKLIGKGWHLLGGLSVTTKTHGVILYTQAMVKHND